MAQRISILRIELPDIPGALVDLLSKAASHAIDIQCLCATGEHGAQGTMYFWPKDIGKARSLAMQGGIAIQEFAGFLLEGEDRPGAGARALAPFSQAGINLVACCAMASKGGAFQLLAVVKPADAEKAAKALGA
ncbi:MAG: hypothetical protein NTW86_02465 [Candidatus Sumerlaeota bacterium]|nr:hypothetical protein [Candidatus Sumerlaeota bacterium]